MSRTSLAGNPGRTADLGDAMLVGHTGFVGGNLQRQIRFERCFNSADIQEIAGSCPDLLIFAGARAEKWRANADPAADLAAIDAAWSWVRETEPAQVVLISTVDAVARPQGLDEATAASAPAVEAYGANRLLLERRFEARFPRLTILRLPGLFGPGLKKNAIFDLIHDNAVDRLNPLSRIQYYPLARLGRDLATAVDAGLDLVHLVTPPLETRAIAARLFPHRRLTEAAAAPADYDLWTRHAARFGGEGHYVQSLDRTMADLRHFVDGAMAVAA